MAHGKKKLGPRPDAATSLNVRLLKNPGITGPRVSKAHPDGTAGGTPSPKGSGGKARVHKSSRSRDGWPTQDGWMGY